MARLKLRSTVIRKIFELLLCIIHPLAVVLIWLDLAQRTDITAFTKLVWALVVIIPVVPFIYVLVSGDLWPFGHHGVGMARPA